MTIIHTPLDNHLDVLYLVCCDHTVRWGLMTLICMSTGLIVAAVRRLATVATALLPPPEGWCFIQTRNGEFGRRWGRGERRDEENIEGSEGR